MQQQVAAWNGDGNRGMKPALSISDFWVRILMTFVHDFEAVPLEISVEVLGFQTCFPFL
jgi:hypothetical protein